MGIIGATGIAATYDLPAAGAVGRETREAKSTKTIQGMEIEGE